MLLLSVLFMMAIGSVSLRGEGSSLHLERRACWIYYFFLLDEVEYTFDIYGAQIFPMMNLSIAYSQNIITQFSIFLV
jgi:hypothetical protein